MRNTINIRQIRSLEELDVMQQVEEAVWQMPPIPVHQTYTALNNGGIILGAYDQDKMIGFLYSFPGFDGKNPYLCSHMLGILPDYRKTGLGMKMKHKQAEIAKQMGFQKITWTFDPLESLNAYLNLHKLGAVGTHYKENHYGNMDDRLNNGISTDRIQIEWDLSGARLNQNVPPFDKQKLLLDSVKNQPVQMEAVTRDFSPSEEGWFAAIPAHFQSIKEEDFELAKAWRYHTRDVFKALFSTGYYAADVIHNQAEGICYYYFSNQSKGDQENENAH